MTAGKAVALVIGGALVGAGVTTLVLKKKYEARAEEDIASVRDSYIKQVNDLESDLSALLDGLENRKPKASAKSATDIPMERVVPTNETLRKAYHKIAPNPEAVEELKETVEGLGYSRKEETVKEEAQVVIDTMSMDADSPYVIPVQSFMDDEENYDQLTLTYYSLDKVLVNEAEEVVEDVDGTVGRHNLHNFGVDSGNDDTVYVRNDKRMADYEILREEKAYSQEVMSIDTWDHSPEPREPIRKFR